MTQNGHTTKTMPQENKSRFGVTISKEELSRLPIARYEGKVVIIEDDSRMAEAIQALRASDIIGFDTETKPTFKKGQFHNVALVQLATRDCCYLFRICKTGFPDSLCALLEDSSVRKVGLSIHDDFHNLLRLRKFTPAGFTDLQQYVKEFEITDNSLSRIYAILFGKRISKSQQLSNWEAAELTPAQQQYASFDALACIHILDHLTTGSFDPAKSPYLREIPSGTSTRQTSQT